jgi:dienelactone hydrolase
MEDTKGNKEYSFSTLDYLRRRLEALPAPAGRSIERKEDWVRHTLLLRARVIELLGGFPPACSLEPVCTAVVERQHCTVERVVYQSEPGAPVPALVLVPKGLDRPAPAVVVFHTHSGDYDHGKEEVFGDTSPLSYNEFLQVANLGERLAETGYVVLAPDCRCFGERKDDEDVAVKAALLQGTTLLGLMTWDNMRALDYLSSRPEVDASRIGAMGLSMGAYHTWLTAALDERISVAVAIGQSSSFRSWVAEGALARHGWFNYVPGLLRYADAPDLLALIAPRPLLAIAGRLDPWCPPGGVDEAAAETARVYTMLGAPDRVQFRRPDWGHLLDEQVLAWVTDWFNRWL